MPKPHAMSFASKADGRKARGVETRRRIVAALFELIESGKPAPTGEEVAERAQVGLRSVYRHFDDIDKLYAEIQERLDAVVRPLVTEATIEGPLEERVRSMTEVRAQLFERISPFVKAGRMRTQTSPLIEQRRAAGLLEMRIWLWSCLPECASAPVPVRNGVEMAVSFAAWDHLRTEQRLSVQDAKACTAQTVLKLLQSPAAG